MASASAWMPCFGRARGACDNPLQPLIVCMIAGNLSMRLPLGPKVKIIDWAAQNDILGHHSVGAFVTHGGINSMHEAIFHAKPVVVIGLTADQPLNAKKVSSQIYQYLRCL